MPTKITGVALLLALCLAGVASAQDRSSALAFSAGRIGSADNGAGSEGMVRSAQQSQVDDPTWDGTAAGALFGAGAGLALTAVMLARCDAGCEGPSPGGAYLFAGGVGAGAGAVVGWLVDKARKGRPRTVDVAPVITTRQKSVRVALHF